MVNFKYSEIHTNSSVNTNRTLKNYIWKMDRRKCICGRKDEKIKHE